MTFEEIAAEQKEKQEFKKAYPKFHNFEKQVVDTMVDKYANKFVQKLGYRRANWLPCVKVLIGIMVILNIMACYARPDFITQIVCVLSILFLSESDHISRDKFRLLPFLLLLSIVYDFIWLIFIQDLVKDGQREHGGLESPVKVFAIHVTWIAWIFKFPFFFVLWKVSYNYLLDIKEITDAPRIIKL